MAAGDLDRFEQEVERSRAELARTLAAFEARLSPGSLVDEAVSAVRVRDAAGKRRVDLDGWSLAAVALAGAWLLWSQRRRAGTTPAPRPIPSARLDPPGERPLPPAPPQLKDAAE